MDWIVETLRRVRELRDWRVSRRRRRRGAVGARSERPASEQPILPAATSGPGGGARGPEAREDRLVPRIGPVEARVHPGPRRDEGSGPARD